MLESDAADQTRMKDTHTSDEDEQNMDAWEIKVTT